MKWTTHLTVRAAALLLLGVGLVVPAAAQPAAASATWLAEAEQHFAAGNQLAGEGRSKQAQEQFRAALLRYERVAEAQGRSNGFLLYNIGNTYLRLGDLGRAVLHYREAQRFIPADPNLRQSLSHARSLRRDQITAEAGGSVLRLVFFWHFTLPLRVRVALFLVAANILWLLALFHRLAGEPGPFGALQRRLARWRVWPRIRRRAGAAVLAIAGVVTVAGGGSVLVELLRPEPDVAVIVAAEVTARRGDSTAYEPSFTTPLRAGTELRVIEERNDWLHVALADGRRTWLPAPALAVVGR